MEHCILWRTSVNVFDTQRIDTLFCAKFLPFKGHLD